MTGAQLYIYLGNILGKQIDETYALALFNLARLDFETRRIWSVLKAKDTSQTVLAGYNPNTPYSIPNPPTFSQTTPGFVQYILEGSLRLVNPNNLQDFIICNEIPFENQVEAQQDNCFYADYPNYKIYFPGTQAQARQIWQFFTADFGDITVATQWVGFPTRFQPALAFQAAARYRLGTDYDDINARNADDNYNASEMMYKAMVKWDENRVLQAHQNLDYSSRMGGGGADSGFQPGRISDYQGNGGF